MFGEKLKEALLSNNNGTERMQTLEEQVHFMMAYERKKCASLLFFGAVFGFLGFAFACIIGIMKFLNPDISEFHDTFNSGNGYFPATVSEMVHNPQGPAGKCFFAFEFVGAFFIFNSWYPWQLRNVYIGDSDSLPFLPRVSWTTFRQFVPPAGMMLVDTITSTPFAQASYLDYICISIHLTGAVMLFVGYIMVEARCLGWCWVKQADATRRTVLDKERQLRKLCLNGILFWYIMFCVLTVLTILPLDKFGGRTDRWEARTEVTPEGTQVKEMVLVDTAAGFVLWLKVLSYASEVFTGLCLIASLMVIWFFCEERHSDLLDSLVSVTDPPRAATVP